MAVRVETGRGRTLRRTIAALCLCACAGVATPQDTARDPVTFKRMLAMGEARATLTRLSDMANGRAVFHPDRARIDRKALIRFARTIPRLFRKDQTDAHSRALPDVWANRTAFRVRAKFAEVAARGLNPRSPETLQATLPALLDACLNCHTRFRREDR